jgi:hypothetical protein
LFTPEGESERFADFSDPRPVPLASGIDDAPSLWRQVDAFHVELRERFCERSRAIEHAQALIDQNQDAAAQPAQAARTANAAAKGFDAHFDSQPPCDGQKLVEQAL